MHQQEPGDLIAGPALGEEQDSQGTAQPENHAEVIPRMGLRLEDSKLLGIVTRQPMIKHTGWKYESGPLGIELAWSLESAAKKAGIGRLRVREKDPFRPPASAAKLPHDTKRRSDTEIVDLVAVLCTLLINNGAYGRDAVSLQQKRGHALTIEMFVNGKGSDRGAQCRREAGQLPWQA
jgi:hypothetical protein